MRKAIVFVIVLLVLLFTASRIGWRVKDRLNQTYYDISLSNDPVLTHQEVDSILAGFSRIDFEELDIDYRQKSKSKESKYERMLKGVEFSIVKQDDLYKRIVHDFRIKDFICKDSYYKACVGDDSKVVHCILDPRIFRKTLELIDELRNAGHDPKAFTIRNGHRHPAYNERIGGASLSRHILGEAVDISVGDINKDGKISKTDKDIILDILEKKVIGDEGGIGLYPGTQSVHFDVRGTRARWNSY